MTNPRVLFWIALLFVFLGIMVILFSSRGFSRSENVNRSSPLILPADTEPLSDFTLIERTGKKFNSAELTDNVWVASFFFSSCPHNCVRQNLAIQDLATKYGPRGARFVSITCDPERDTPMVLAEYADRFDADDEQWLFLTGPLDYIQRIGGELFKVSIEPTTHSEKLILVQPDGQIRGYFHWNDPQQMDLFHSEIKAILETTAAGAERPEAAPSSTTRETG